MAENIGWFIVGGCVLQICYINENGETVCMPYKTKKRVKRKIATPLAEIAILHTK